MAVQPNELTFDDYLSMPEDGLRYEIVAGRLLVSPAPSYRHQIAAINLLRFLTEYVIPRKLGRVLIAPFTVRLTPNEPVEPDLLFVSSKRMHMIDEHACHGAPDLIIEILSPSHERSDRVVKFNRYQEAGVREYWIVDPVSNTVQQYVLRSQAYVAVEPISLDVVVSEAISGLTIRREDIFDETR